MTGYSQRREPIILLGLAVCAIALSGYRPKADVMTWLLEAGPVLIALPFLIGTASRFPLTPLLYRLIFVHALVLLLGAHYTYAEVPPGFWLRDAFDLQRNHYDRLGHVMQGLQPAILAREILLRKQIVARGGWLYLLCVCICLAFSAFYELLEWWTALAAGAGAQAFLGTQGDIWDTQWDMFLALLGANFALLVFSKSHDQQLTILEARDVSTRGR